MKSDQYNALQDIYFFQPINEKIREIIEEALEIDKNIAKLQGCIYEFCDERGSSLEECWLHLIMELNIKGYDLVRDDILESFYSGTTGELNVEMTKYAFDVLGYDV